MPVAVILGVAALATAARAQEPPGPTVRGEVGGDLVRGKRVRFRVAVTHPEGWRALDRAVVAVQLQGVTLDEVAYDVGEGIVSLGGSRAVAGTGNALEGRFLRVDAFEVTVSTGGNRLELGFPARVVRDLPDDARIRFVGEDDAGRSVGTTVRPEVPEESGGISATTVILTAAAALLAGGYLGVRMATHRRRPSIYESVARRIVEDREARRPKG
jgi:hypothetical protein